MTTTAEEKLASRLTEIEVALNQALNEAAGESMAYILLVTPVGRVGEHILTSNITSRNVIMKFMSMARIQLRNQWQRAEKQFVSMKKQGLN